MENFSQFDFFRGTVGDNNYLKQYPDVAAAVQSGQLSSGHAHWIISGKSEGRIYRTNLFSFKYLLVLVALYAAYKYFKRKRARR